MPICLDLELLFFKNFAVIHLISEAPDVEQDQEYVCSWTCFPELSGTLLSSWKKNCQKGFKDFWAITLPY